MKINFWNKKPVYFPFGLTVYLRSPLKHFKIKIIVARYNEDISWTQEFSNVIIYNKGSIIYDIPQIPLKNVGRESHTYYHYIYTNYGNLDDFTVFLQGNPFDHSPNIIHNLKKYSILPPSSDFTYLSEKSAETYISGFTTIPKSSFANVYEKIFETRLPENTLLSFNIGAQFIVSKKSIHKYPKEFYLKIIKILEYDINPIEGFCFEILHKYIFQNFLV